ncbi:MAG TPA: crosslink repair DNA glycosylase YcaQ family protein [Baekduia sp.]|nr:crosslink repair DNA glycosylase YcaQ family protein [Baekduia sp.]
MSLLDQARAFTYERQQLGRSGADPLAMLDDIVGVYSSHPSAPLTLRARIKDLAPPAFTRLDEERLAVRIAGPRGSIHLVSRACAGKIAGAFSSFEVHNRSAYKYFGIDEAQVPALQAKVLAAAAEPVAAGVLKQATGLEEGTNAIVGSLTRSGQLLRLAAPGLRSNALRYVRTESWLGAPLERDQPEAARAWLAERYLRAFGPAERDDFRWWSGFAAAEADAALAAIDTTDVGDGLLLRTEDVAAFEQARPVSPTAIDLIPKWDMLAMGYPAAGRARFLDRDNADRAYDHRGDSIAQILIGGVAQGAWTMKAAGKQLQFTLDYFERPTAKLRSAVEAEFTELAAFLGASGAVFR